MSLLGPYWRFNRLDAALSAQRGRLHRLALAWCGDPALADDLVQDTLIKALERQAQLRNELRLDAWLYKILHNVWMDYLRTCHPSLDIDEELLLSSHNPEQALADEQWVERVQAAIEALPVGQRQVLTLVELEGCSYEQVAHILEIPVGTVMSRLSRAREMLKQRLAKWRAQEQTPYLRRVK